MFSICRNFLEIFSGSFTVTIKINSSKKTVFHRETFIPMQMQMYQILIRFSFSWSMWRLKGCNKMAFRFPVMDEVNRIGRETESRRQALVFIVINHHWSDLAHSRQNNIWKWDGSGRPAPASLDKQSRIQIRTLRCELWSMKNRTELRCFIPSCSFPRHRNSFLRQSFCP